MRARRFKNLEEFARAWEEEKDKSKIKGYSPGGAAAKLGVERKHVYRLIEEGELDALVIGGEPQVGKIVEVTEESIKRWLQSPRRRLKKIV
jgi:excisionase family DNA binding protein